MATLEEAKAIEQAKTSKSLTMGTSAFTTGAKFKITGYEYAPVENSKVRFPAFQTTLGILSVNSLLRAISVKPYEDKETGERISTRQPSGTFHEELRRILGEHRGKTNDEVLPILVNTFKDRELVVRQREYVTTEGQYGDRPRPICHIDLVVD